jgi:hypothetical protein
MSAAIKAGPIQQLQQPIQQIQQKETAESILSQRGIILYPKIFIVKKIINAVTAFFATIKMRYSAAQLKNELEALTKKDIKSLTKKDLIAMQKRFLELSEPFRLPKNMSHLWETPIAFAMIQSHDCCMKHLEVLGKIGKEVYQSSDYKHKFSHVMDSKDGRFYVHLGMAALASRKYAKKALIGVLKERISLADHAVSDFSSGRKLHCAEAQLRSELHSLMKDTSIPTGPAMMNRFLELSKSKDDIHRLYISQIILPLIGKELCKQKSSKLAHPPVHEELYFYQPRFLFSKIHGTDDFYQVKGLEAIENNPELAKRALMMLLRFKMLSLRPFISPTNNEKLLPWETSEKIKKDEAV